MNFRSLSKSIKNLLIFTIGSDLVIRVDSPALSSAAIIGIAIGGVLLLIILIDFLCCLIVNAGIMATLCRRTKRSPSELDDESKIGR